MATPQGFASNGAFVPEIWAEMGLEMLKPQLHVTRKIAKHTDFSQAFNVGNKINIPVPGTFNAPRKTTGTATSLQTPRGMTEVELTLTHHRTLDFIVEDVTRAQANPGLMASLMESAIAGLSRAIEQDVISALMGGTFSGGTAGTNITAASIIDASVALDGRLIPQRNRHMVLTPKDKGAALSDTQLRGYFNFNPQATLSEGTLPDIYGFATDMSQLAPRTAVQRLNFVGGNNGETFRLRWNNFETADIAFNSTPATLVGNIQTALRAMTEPITMGAGTVSVAGAAITAIDITFAGTALNYMSAVAFSTEGVAGTAYTGTCAVTETGTVTSTNLCFHKDAAVFAPRRLPQVAAGAISYEVLDDDPIEGTGVALRLINQYDRANRGSVMAFDVLYGVVLARNAAVYKLTA